MLRPKLPQPQVNESQLEHTLHLTLLYNSETWGVTKIVMGKVDCFHRRQLRHLLGIRYPDRITNHDLYARCKAEPVSSIINRRCLRLAGHIFRLGEDTPPWLAMKSYFSADSPGVRGRPKTTIVTILKSQLAELGIRFNNFNDLAPAAPCRCQKENLERTHQTDITRSNLVVTEHERSI